MQMPALIRHINNAFLGGQSRHSKRCQQGQQECRGKKYKVNRMHIVSVNLHQPGGAWAWPRTNPCTYPASAGSGHQWPAQNQTRMPRWAKKSTDRTWKKFSTCRKISAAAAGA